MSERSLESLEEEYRQLLSGKISEMKQKTNLTSTSRLESDHGRHTSMGAAQGDLVQFREDFAVSQKRKHGNVNFTGDRTYEQILQGVQRGDYRQ